ncbi:acyl-CoA thioesterase [Bacteroidota bacterium]
MMNKQSILISTRTSYRVRYSDTDQMGVVYYGEYPRFYEMGRSEMIRDFGYSYKELEESGVFMPVASMTTKYHRPLYYDELITIETALKEIPKARMVFYHTIYNANMEIVNTAEVMLVFLSKATNRPVRVPDHLVKVLEVKCKEILNEEEK